MRKVLFSFLILWMNLSLAQSFSVVDQKVSSYPGFTSVEALGYRIMNDFEDDEARVRAAFIWITHNISIGRNSASEEQVKTWITYESEKELKKGIQRLVNRKIRQAFKNRKGVCIDFSLMLNALCEQFGLPSKVILGTAKTQIKKVAAGKTFKNHTWNAVWVGGKWNLMDPSWASGHVDMISGRFIRQYLDHYFFTRPEDFIKHHLPANPEWQLLDQPKSTSAFFTGPIFFPDYFNSGITLSAKTSGIIRLNIDSPNHLIFEDLPKIHGMHYKVGASWVKKRLGLKKQDDNSYTARIRLGKIERRGNKAVTIFKDDKPLLQFKVITEEFPNPIYLSSPSG